MPEDTAMLEEDYLMRMIHQMIHGLRRLLFKTQEETIASFDAPAAEKFTLLLSLIDHGKINKAENYLFDQLNTQNLEELRMALLFYERLAQLSTQELARADFSAAEIQKGAEDILRIFGYDGLICWLDQA
jgi:hypothetical protein